MKELSMLSGPHLLNKELTGNAQRLPTWSDQARAGKDFPMEEFEVAGHCVNRSFVAFSFQRGVHPRKLRQDLKKGLRVVYK